MKATFISKENNDVKFSMDFTAEEFDKAVVNAYQETKDQFMIDGFRKGKAPRSIIEKHYGEGIFFEDAINNLFQGAYPFAIKELDLEPINSPSAEFSEIGKGKPLTITITVPVYPVIEVKDYKGVEVEQVIGTVSDKDVQRELDSMQQRNARVVSVDRTVHMGDTVILDYAGFVGDDQFEGGTAENQELKIGSGMFIPGFEEQLVGAEKEKAADVKVTFPEEYHAPDLAGKEAVFHCMIHEIKEEQLPELDDEFAKDVSEFDTLDELKKSIEEKLQKYADAQSESDAKDAIIEKVFEANRFDVPEIMVEDELDRMLQEIDQQLRAQGLGLEQYLKFVQKDMADFRNEMREEASKKVETRVMLMSIVGAEEITVSDEELEKELEDMAKAYNTNAEELKKMLGAESLELFKKDIQLKKVIDMLYAEAAVTKVEKKETEETAEEK